MLVNNNTRNIKASFCIEHIIGLFFANNKCLCLNSYNNQNSIKIALCPFIVINLADLIMEILS